MSQKTLNLLLALGGLAVIAAIACVGLDIHRAAHTGPRWKRRLVAAGLALLAALGVPACEQASEAGGPATASAARSLTDTVEWKRLLATWREGEEVASGKRGAYPFDRKGKKRLLASIQQSWTDCGKLQAAGQFSVAEADLLKADLDRLALGVQAKRPTEMRMATCYKPMMHLPARDSLKRLTTRLPLLERLAGSQKLQSDVVRKTLVSVERDLAILGQQEDVDRLSEADRAKAAEIREAVAGHVARIKARLGGKPSAALDRSPDWQVITDAWATAVPLAKSRKSTTAQRKTVDAKFKAATAAAQRLATAGLLAPQEADLLTAEAANIRADIYRDPPTDCKFTCYDMAYMPPARVSFERLGKRLPVIEKLIAGGTVHPAACVKIVAAIEADLAVLSDAKQLKAIQGPQRAKIEASRDQARAALARLKQMLDKRS